MDNYRAFIFVKL